MHNTDIVEHLSVTYDRIVNKFQVACLFTLEVLCLFNTSSTVNVTQLGKDQVKCLEKIMNLSMEQDIVGI